MKPKKKPIQEVKQKLWKEKLNSLYLEANKANCYHPVPVKLKKKKKKKKKWPDCSFRWVLVSWWLNVHDSLLGFFFNMFQYGDCACEIRNQDFSFVRSRWLRWVASVTPPSECCPRCVIISFSIFVWRFSPAWDTRLWYQVCICLSTVYYWGITTGLEIGLLAKITFWSLLKVPFKTDLLVKTV